MRIRSKAQLNISIQHQVDRLGVKDIDASGVASQKKIGGFSIRHLHLNSISRILVFARRQNL